MHLVDFLRIYIPLRHVVVKHFHVMTAKGEGIKSEQSLDSISELPFHIILNQYSPLLKEVVVDNPLC